MAERLPVPLLARATHDRVAHRRRDDSWIAHALAATTTRVVVLSARSTAEVADGGLVLRSVERARALVPRRVEVLLGEDDGIAYFAMFPVTSAEPSAAETSEPDPIGQDGRWETLRELGAVLSDRDTGLLTAAVALQSWHHLHPRCPRCGSRTQVTQAGWSRTCPSDGSEHFPRTDPAVIMLILDEEERCLLGRGPLWPEGRMSILAGFVEAGESAEAAVVREVAEEVGISVTDVRYVASQPHPFPASLMLGYTARVSGDPTLHPDRDEIVTAGWFTREQVRTVGEWGSEQAANSDSDLRALPPSFSIARQLIEAWLNER